MNTPELVWAAIITGGLALVGVLSTAFVTWRKQADAKQTAKQVAQEVLSYLATGNGHTAGEALARIEDRSRELDDRLDRVEMRLVDDLSDIKERLAKAAEHRNEIASQAKEAVFAIERHASEYRHERRPVDE